MLQFDLTPEECVLVVDAVRARAYQYIAMYGVTDPVLEALAEKMSAAPAPAVEEAVVAEEAPVVVTSFKDEAA
jgi:hypothetical protein